MESKYSKEETQKCHVFIKEFAKSLNIKMWEIANKIGIHENSLYRWLRVGLTPQKEIRIYKAISDIADDKKIDKDVKAAYESAAENFRKRGGV